MPNLGPNTNAASTSLRKNCLLCGGEDRGEFLQAAAAAFGKPPEHDFSYRCYEFWVHHEIVLILTGIGTGTLEPLLWEILQPKIIERIILVGTAGICEGSQSTPAVPYGIDRAFLAGTGLDGESIEQPLRPRWKMPADLKQASSVSTDFFYGYSPRLLRGDYPLRGGQLEKRYKELAGKVDLVEMEVAQFYCFCERFAGAKDLRYLAIKSPSNIIGDLDTQTQLSPKALTACIKAARDAFEAGE